MIISDISLEKVHYWYLSTKSRATIVIDTIIVKQVSNEKELLLDFPRFKSFCYIESIRDFAYIHSPQIEFLTLKNFLLRNAKDRYYDNNKFFENFYLSSF